MSGKVNRTKIIIDGENKGAVTAFNQVGQKLYQAERDIKGFGGSVSSTLGTVTRLFDNFGTVAVGALSALATGLIYMAKEQITAIDEMQKFGDRIGANVEFLSAMKYATQLSGLEFNTFTMALQRMTRRAAEAADGTGSAKDAFTDLGVELRNSKGELKGTEELFMELATALNNVGNSGERLQYAFKIFDSEGTGVIQMTKEGAAGLKEMISQAEELGLVVSTETARSIENFNDTLTNLKGQFGGLINSSLPAITALMKDLSFIADQGFWEYVKAVYTFDEEAFDSYATKLDELNKKRNDWYEEQRKFAEEERKRRKEEREKKAEIAAEKRLREEMKKTREVLQAEIDMSSLGKFHTEVYKIKNRAKELREMFGDDPIVGNWVDAMIYKLSDFESVMPAGTDDNIELGGMVPDILPMEQYRDEYVTILDDITAAEMAAYAIRQGYAQTTFNNMSQAMLSFYQMSDQRSKAAFTAYKAFSIAEAIVSTYTGAANALAATPAGPWNFVLAASIVAQGLANVARISSTNIGSTSSAGGGGGSSYVPRREIISPPANTESEGNSGTTVTINVNTLVGEDQWVRNNLIPTLQKAYGDGA